MPQSEKVKIFDQLWRLVKLGEFVALQEENFLTLSVSGESREESLHRADLLCAVIRAMRTAIAGDRSQRSPCEGQGDR